MVPVTQFVPGLELCRRFYSEAVRPLLEGRFPRLAYSAARLGHGSDVLGFDSQRSIDHEWGPHLQLFLGGEDYQRHCSHITDVLSQELPVEIAGYPTHFGDTEENGIKRLQSVGGGPIDHRVEPTTIRRFFRQALAFDPYREITVVDWLAFPQQELLGITAGEVFHDGLGELDALREKFGYYPKDVWLYLIACQWTKISREEPFPGRCAEAGDELGSRIVAARQVREIMRLCFLFEKTYAPYSKWLGSAFDRLRDVGELAPMLLGILKATTWPEREKWLSRAYEFVARRHNSLGITRQLPAEVSSFWGRPYLVIHADQFAEATREAIEDENVRSLGTMIGAVDQFADSTDFLSYPDVFGRSRGLFDISDNE